MPVGTEGSTVIKQLRRRKGCLWETDKMLRAEKQRRVLSGPGFWVDRLCSRRERTTVGIVRDTEQCSGYLKSFMGEAQVRQQSRAQKGRRQGSAWPGREQQGEGVKLRDWNPGDTVSHVTDTGKHSERTRSPEKPGSCPYPWDGQGQQQTFKALAAQYWGTVTSALGRHPPYATLTATAIPKSSLQCAKRIAVKM